MNLRFLFFFLFISQLLWGQAFTTHDNVGEKSHAEFIKARKANYTGDYLGALKILQKVLKKKPNYIEALSLKGGIHYELNEFDKAESTLKKAIALAPSYMPKNIYFLGRMYYSNDRYSDAAKMMAHYMKYKSQLKSTDVAKAQKVYDNSIFAAKAIATPVPYNPQNMGVAINSQWLEYLPALTADGNTLILTRRIRGQEDFYISRKKEGVWETAKPFGPPINTDGNEGAQAISADGKTIIYTKCKGGAYGGDCNLVISENIDGEWTEPKGIGAPVNTKHWESQPTLSADGTTLYYVSNRPDGKGNEDIWKSIRHADGTWTEPINVEELNTVDDDAVPFLHADGQTLYFISDGRIGMGNRDIYYTRLSEDGKWEEPINIGYPINNKKEQAGIIVNFEGTKAYYSSVEENMGLDLFEFDIPLEARPKQVTYVIGKVLDEESKAPIIANVEVVDLSTNTIVTELKSRADGSFLIALTAGKEYGFDVSKNGYSIYSKHFEFKDVKNITDPYETTITLTPIADQPKEEIKGKVITLNNIFFESGSSILLDKSFPELGKVYELLYSNNSISVVINGHTDNVGTEVDNNLLSQQRAESVKRYLIEKGILNSRIRTRGYGESKPIDTNDTESGRRNNRRTEIEIL